MTWLFGRLAAPALDDSKFGLPALGAYPDGRSNFASALDTALVLVHSTFTRCVRDPAVRKFEEWLSHSNILDLERDCSFWVQALVGQRQLPTLQYAQFASRNKTGDADKSLGLTII